MKNFSDRFSIMIEMILKMMKIEERREIDSIRAAAVEAAVTIKLDILSLFYLF